MMHRIEYRKVWKFGIIPLMVWLWCVIEEYQEMLCMGADIAWVDRDRVIFKSKDKTRCVDLLKKLEEIKK